MSRKRKIDFEEYSEIFKIQKRIEQASVSLINKLKKKKNKLPIQTSHFQENKDYNILIQLYPKN